MEEAAEVVFRPGAQVHGPWTQYEQDRRAPKKSDRRIAGSLEIQEDKEALKSEIKALIDGIDTALMRQMDTGHGHTRISIYETARGDAAGLLAALNSGGSSHVLEALREKESVIKNNFLEVVDKKAATGSDDDDSDDDNTLGNKKSKVLLSQADVNKQVEADPFMRLLGTHRQNIHELKLDNEAMQADIASSANDGKRDLQAAIAVAVLLSEGKDIGQHLKDLEAKMQASDESAGSGATVAERLAVIKEEGEKIHDSMAQGRAQTSASIADAAQHLVDLHLGGHAEEYAQHSAKVRAEFASCKFSGEEKEFDTQAAQAQQHVRQTMQDLKEEFGKSASAQSGDASPVTGNDLKGLTQDMNLDRVFDMWQEKGSEGAKLLEAHRAVYHQASQKIDATQDHLAKLLKGHSAKGAEEVAAVLSVPRDEVLDHATVIQDQILAGQIEAINARWRSQSQGQGQDSPPPLPA